MPVIITLSVIILLIAVIGGYTFFTACRRRPDLPWHDPEVLQKTAYAKHIRMIAYSIKWLEEHNPTDIYVTIPDGLKLHSLWIPAENPRGTILLL